MRLFDTGGVLLTPHNLNADELIEKARRIIVSVFLCFSGAVVPFYPGNRILYMMFVSTFVVLTWGAIDRKSGWFYAFLSVFILLAFPIKLGIHLISGLQFNESVGSFNYTAAGYDVVIIVTSTGVLGVLLGKCAFSFFAGKFFKLRNDYSFTQVENNFFPWLVFSFALSLVIANYFWGFFHVGLASATILPYHLTSLVFWAFNFGLVFLLAHSSNSSIRNKGDVDRKGVLILVVFLLIACSIYSRAPLIFLAGPLLFVTVFKGYSFLSFRRIGLYLATWILCLGISFVGVSYLRALNYFQVEKTQVEKTQVEKTQVEKTQVEKTQVKKIRMDIYLGQLSKLFVDRWVGLEGIASVSSYSSKGWPLLWEAFNESSSAGTDGLYAKISKSPFLNLDADMKKTMIVGGTPGLFAFLFLSGDLRVVFLGALLIIFIVLTLERGAQMLVGCNPYLMAIMGCMVARVVVSFSYVDMFWKFMVELILTVLLYHLILRRLAALALIKSSEA